jgi:hypothetical protein
MLPVGTPHELTIDEVGIVAGGGHFVAPEKSNLLDGAKSPLVRIIEGAALAASKAGTNTVVAPA